MRELNVKHRLARLMASSRSNAHKIGWGVGVVGLLATLQGIVRTIALHLMRPRYSEIRLRSGPLLEFNFPSQVPTALIMFGDVIDPEFAFLRGIARPDWVVADVGAAIGQFTLFAARLPVRLIHAFEPSSANVLVLRRNVARNEVAGSVEIHQLALGESEYEAFFETTDRTWVSRISQTVGNDHPVGRTEKVQVRTLAGELDRLGVHQLSVLKINVAGFEAGVLAGAEPLLARGGADILVLLLGLVCLPEYAKLAGWGYRFFYFHPREKALYEIVAFDADSVLCHRPWPARHIIAIHSTAMSRHVTGDMPIRAIRSPAGDRHLHPLQIS